MLLRDSTVGKKERERQEKTQDTLRRSSEETVKEQNALQKKSRKKRRAMKTAVVLLAVVAVLLALARWCRKHSKPPSVRRAFRVSGCPARRSNRAPSCVRIPPA